MPTGAFTGYMDVAQMVLYAFWIFFFGLVFYLRREDKREGYPLESDRSERSSRVEVVGWPRPPEPKSYLLPLDQGVRFVPRPEAPLGDIPGTRPTTPAPGSPLEPTGNPMLDGVGPASYPPRDDLPDLAFVGGPKVVPMRIATEYMVEHNDPDPRGMDVVAADGKVAGTVKDLWVDRSEHRILYFEVALNDAEEDGAPNVLLPYGFARVKFGRGQLLVSSITADQFRSVPRTASDEQITRLEEDRIAAYFSSGHLYGSPTRQDPLF